MQVNDRVYQRLDPSTRSGTVELRRPKADERMKNDLILPLDGTDPFDPGSVGTVERSSDAPADAATDPHSPGPEPLEVGPRHRHRDPVGPRYRFRYDEFGPTLLRGADLTLVLFGAGGAAAGEAEASDHQDRRSNPATKSCLPPPRAQVREENPTQTQSMPCVSKYVPDLQICIDFCPTPWTESRL